MDASTTSRASGRPTFPPHAAATLEAVDADGSTRSLRRAQVPPHALASLEGVGPQVTIPIPAEFIEAVAQRVAELLREQPLAQRFMDSEAAADYLGIPAKTLKTKEWRDENAIPYSYIGSRLIFDRLALDERFASCSGAPGGSYTVSRVASALTAGAVR